MNKEKGINVLSLFDGISCGQLALKQLNIPIDNYFASEIDKNAIKVSQHHFPNSIQLGDVRDVECDNLPPIDLLIFGSPCQNLTILSKDRTGLSGDKSSLFYEALRILDKVKPKYFLMENVASMHKHDRTIITNLLGVRPIKINSNLVSAQNRNRIYWTNIPGVEIPKDRKIALKSIVESGYVDRRKSNAVLTKNIPYTINGLTRYLTKSIGGVIFRYKEFACLPDDIKLYTIEMHTNESVKGMFRPFTIRELERLQTLPDSYVGDIIKKTPAHKAIGNAFTVEVIKHILSYADFSTN